MPVFLAKYFSIFSDFLKIRQIYQKYYRKTFSSTYLKSIATKQDVYFEKIFFVVIQGPAICCSMYPARTPLCI